MPRGLRAKQPWPDYQAVWRWHFYAGLFCIPFVVWLAVTGSIYLFKPQVEGWIDRPFANLTSPGLRAPPSAEVRTALAGARGSVLHAYQLPRGSGDAAQVLVGSGPNETRMWVDPRASRILKTVSEDDRFMKVIFRLHGELLLGDRGSMLVELAASWAVVMIITGLFLWWPRGATGLGGVLYPRLHLGGRLLLRDIHAVVAVWVSGAALLLLVSGLPWAKNWGGLLTEVRQLSSKAMVRPDWTAGRSAELAQRAALSAGSLAGQTAPRSGDMAGMDMGGAGGGRAQVQGLGVQRLGVQRLGVQRMGVPRPGAPRLGTYDGIDRIAPTVAALNLAYPVLIIPPTTPGGAWSARSDAQNRTKRVSVTLDRRTGAVRTRQDFQQRDWVDQAVGVGVAAHEGQLFGWPNQLLGLLTATGLATASVSAVLLWLRRRAEGVLGAPLPAGAPRFSKVLLGVILILGLLLPLLGMSLLCVLVVERYVLARVPKVRLWLGLRAPQGSVTSAR